MLGCYRYIELNPVRADMVEYPASIAGLAMVLMPRVMCLIGWFPIRVIRFWGRPWRSASASIASCFVIRLILSWWIRFAGQLMAIMP